PAAQRSAVYSTQVHYFVPPTTFSVPSTGTLLCFAAEAVYSVLFTYVGVISIGQATADGSGNWSFTPGTPLTNGTVINALAQDAAGNTSGPGSTTMDAVAPVSPVIEPSNGAELSGTAELGVRVIITDGNGKPIGKTLAEGSGNWTFT
ncbi:Ig-like domain-containing protein, partial [Pseudomonas aeruginosa]|uniref:Ig-like domain-containing protein n=1 Tax=Pseudomonas aeruginosa TaxID=287 RepID=UPI0035BBD1DF